MALSQDPAMRLEARAEPLPAHIASRLTAFGFALYMIPVPKSRPHALFPSIIAKFHGIRSPSLTNDVPIDLGSPITGHATVDTCRFQPSACVHHSVPTPMQRVCEIAAEILRTARLVLSLCCGHHGSKRRQSRHRHHKLTHCTGLLPRVWRRSGDLATGVASLLAERSGRRAG
jgi:hypothetical protein